MPRYTEEITRQAIVEAYQVFAALSDLSFKNNKGTHAIIRNVTFLESAKRDIEKTLLKIRDKFIRKDEDGNPKRRFRKDEEGELILDQNENPIPVGWDWEENGQEDAEKEQQAYLDETEEVKYYRFKQELLSPAYRYVNQGRHASPVREEVYISPSDIRKIMFAFEDVEDEDEAEDEQTE